MFEKRKKIFLKKLMKAIDEGKVDKEIMLDLIRINKFPFVYTTSSCAGRIVLLHDLGNKKDSYFIARWHSIVSEKEFFEKIKKVKEKNGKGKVWLKVDPFILHIVSKNLEIAKNILNVCFSVGFKHSGIISLKNDQIVVEVNGLDRMEIPIYDENFGFLVNKDQLVKMLKIANEKLMKNKERRERFFALLFKTLKEIDERSISSNSKK